MPPLPDNAEQPGDDCRDNHDWNQQDEDVEHEDEDDEYEQQEEEKCEQALMLCHLRLLRRTGGCSCGARR